MHFLKAGKKMSVLPLGPNSADAVTSHPKRRASLERIDGMPVLIPLIERATRATFSQEASAPTTPKKNLRDYLAKWSPNVSLEDAKQYIRDGKRLLLGILSGDIVDPIQVEGGSMQALTLLAWCLMSGALKKNQAHLQGSFSIEDPQKLIYKFFYKVQESKTRTSSHYPNRRPVVNPIMRMFFSQMGVNVLTGKMPGDQKHLLFGPIKNMPTCSIPLFFLKFEPYSPFLLSGPQPFPLYAPSLEVPFVDLTCHTVCYGKSAWTKTFCPSSNDELEMHKEYPPATTLDAFNQCCQEISSKNLEKINMTMYKKGFMPDVASNKSEYGIGYMSQFIEELKTYQEDETIDSAHIKAFKNAVADLDHLDRRTGREVYFTVDEIYSLVTDPE